MGNEILKELEKMNGHYVQVRINGDFTTMIQIEELNVSLNCGKNNYLKGNGNVDYITINDCENEEICDIDIRMDSIKEYSSDEFETILIMENGNVITIMLDEIG